MTDDEMSDLEGDDNQCNILPPAKKYKQGKLSFSFRAVMIITKEMKSLVLLAVQPPQHMGMGVYRQVST